ncbi:multidrug effflux MFS transporter [Rothia sp. CCM 9417]|uniref:multidrug effflux MFS transporter n=1 Tax=unclassified Rothia (in: high G+C Gram-positive bacteria) TaxID=2689056 RepID=UPI003AC14276
MTPKQAHLQADSPSAGLPLIAIFTLASLTAVGPLAIDMYLAALPTIAEEFSSSAALTQFTLTSFMLGMGSGQFLVGPLSDKTGRLLPLRIGVFCCALATLACAFAPTIQALILARFFMGFAGSIGLVLSRAIVTDSTRGKETARLMSIMMMINGLAPVLAPILGGIVLSYGSWQDIFKLLALIITLSMILVLTFIKESLPLERRRRGSLASTYRGVIEVAQNPSYRGFMLTMVLAFGALFAYISGSSYLLQKVLGLDAVHFTYVFGFNSLGIVLVSSLNARLVSHFAPVRLLTWGAWSLLASSALLTVHFLAGASLLPTLILLFTFTSSLGLVLGNASALALSQVRQEAGAGSALLGTTQALMGALASPLVALGGSQAYLPMAVTMFGFALLAVLALMRTPREAKN